MRRHVTASLLPLLCSSFIAIAAGAPTEPFRGMVLAADGSPAAGAIVWAAKFSHAPLERRETVADAQGRFVLDLSPGKWNVWSRRGSQGGEWPAIREHVEIVGGRPPEPVTMKMDERGMLRGRLVEAESGKAIPGGKLFLDAGLVLIADPDGRFDVGGLYRGGHESFVVAPGRVRMRVLFDTTGRADADTELDVPVPRGGKIVGRVTDSDGKPIAGAYVGRRTSGSYYSINGLYLACDADGRFEYDDAVLPGLPTRLWAAAPGHVEEERDGTVPESGGPLQLNFRLRPKAPEKQRGGLAADEKRRLVSGVVRGPDEKPVAGVLVRAGFPSFTDVVQTRTDEHGRFRLTTPDKEEVLTVLPRVHTPQFPRVAAGGDQSLEINLSAGHSPRGRVTDADGKPIANVQVIATVPPPDPRVSSGYWLSESAVRTNAEGVFELKGIPDHSYFDFLKAGLTDVRRQLLNLDGKDNVVVMQHGGAVSGRVVDKDGKPIRNFRVLVGFPRNRRPGEQTQGVFAGYSGIGVRFTADDGGFVLTGVGADSVYRIRALADGHGEAVAERVVAVPLNRLTTTAPVTLQAGSPVRFRVRTVASDGTPVAGATVTLIDGQPTLDRRVFWPYSGWENTVRRRSAADGWADFPSLSFGGATLLVQAPGLARHRQGWRNEEKELTIELKPEAILDGEVRDATGEPIQMCYVTLIAGGDQIAARVGPDDKGRFRVGELPAGAWTIMVRGKDGLAPLFQGQVELKAGETKAITIDAAKP